MNVQYTVKKRLMYVLYKQELSLKLFTTGCEKDKECTTDSKEALLQIVTSIV
jgi:hypothetical protein